MRSLRILVVEDDTIVGLLLAELLEEMGHDVCAIEGTQTDAVAAAARCVPDLMIVDIGLSEGNGVSAVETIRRSEPIPYLYMSGDLSKIRALKPDAVALHKPFHEPDLAGAIQCALTSTAS